MDMREQCLVDRERLAAIETNVQYLREDVVSIKMKIDKLTYNVIGWASLVSLIITVSGILLRALKP